MRSGVVIRLLAIALVAASAVAGGIAFVVHDRGRGSAPVPAVAAGKCKTDLTPALGRLGVPGLSAGIVKHGRLVCTATAGRADIARGRPVRPDTLFLLASVSKTVTATALLQLADRGRIRSLDDRINGYLPASLQVANPHCGKHNKGVITFRQLLTHTASIVDPPDLDVPRAFAGDDAAQVDPTKLGKDLRTYLTPRGSSWRNGRHFDRGHCPGEKYRYSNVGTTLLGYLVQEIAGTSFIEFTKTNIFAPLGMTETSWNLRDLPDQSRIATPYETNDGGFHALPQYGEWGYPDGMLRTSVTQLARFLNMVIRHGEYGGRRILDGGTVREMRRRQLPAKLDPDQALTYYYDAFGGASRDVLGHNGEDDGASANMYFSPRTGVGVILLGNGGWYDENGEDRSEDLLDDLYREGDSSW